MKKIFIAFTSPKIKQKKIHNIESYYECWNLNKYDLEEFIVDIKKEIPPINNNVLQNYKIDEAEENDNSIFGISKDEFMKCSWGLLLPDSVPGSLTNGYSEIIFLLNLYSPYFLYPVFYVTDFGITKPRHKKHAMLYFHGQNQAKVFKRKEFVKYFEKLLPQSVYGTWQRDRCKNWDKEDWRLFVASLLYQELKDYEFEKEAITWQREAADMITILECLFTAEDSINEEIGYRLRKRLAALIGFRFKDIEKDIKQLYTERSKFVHGSFFVGVGKEAKKENSVSALPLPDFEFLYKHKEYVRYALIAYLNLALQLKQSKIIGTNSEIKRPLDLLEKSIIDLNLRIQISRQTKELFSLLPQR